MIDFARNCGLKTGTDRSVGSDHFTWRRLKTPPTTVELKAHLLQLIARPVNNNDNNSTLHLQCAPYKECPGAHIKIVKWQADH